MASPASSPSASPESDKQPPAAAATPPAKPPPATWSHPETVSLIQIYQDKWCANNRATLKAPHWQDIAALVASRFAGSGASPDKTPTQCRHKIEKLRKRFRTLRDRRGGSAGWPYYDLIDRLERGADAIPQPVPLRAVKSRDFRGHRLDYDDDYYRDGEDSGYIGVDDNCDEDEKPGNYSRMRSMDHILQRPSKVRRFPSNSRAVPSFVPMRDDHAANGQAEWNTAIEKERALESELAREIRAFGEKYVGVEKAKMEMFKEAERRRMEMENKRIKMILEAQRQLVKVIANAFAQPQKGTTVADKESD